MRTKFLSANARRGAPPEDTGVYGSIILKCKGKLYLFLTKYHIMKKCPVLH
jgi:hypothetical protein